MDASPFMRLISNMGVFYAVIYTRVQDKKESESNKGL